MFHAFICIDEAPDESAVSAFPFPTSENLASRPREMTTFLQPRCASLPVYRLNQFGVLGQFGRDNFRAQRQLFFKIQSFRVFPKSRFGIAVLASPELNGVMFFDIAFFVGEFGGVR
jgi:hypothetical protein